MGIVYVSPDPLPDPEPPAPAPRGHGPASDGAEGRLAERAANRERRLRRSIAVPVDPPKGAP